MNNCVSLTIGIPTYNRRVKLERAIESVFKQSYPHWNLIVVNNNSSDDTASYLSCLRDGRLRFFNNDANIGLHANLLRTMDLATTEYFTWLSDDDYINDVNYLDKVATAISKNKEVGIVYGGRVLHNEKTGKHQSNVFGLGRIYTSASEWWSHRDPSMIINISGVFFRRTLFQDSLRKDPGAGWGYDDLVYTSFVQNSSAIEILGASICMDIAVADNNINKCNHSDILRSLRNTKYALLDIVDSENCAISIKNEAKGKIHKKFSEASIFQNYLKVQLLNKDGSLSNFIKFITSEGCGLLNLNWRIIAGSLLFSFPHCVRKKLID